MVDVPEMSGRYWLFGTIKLPLTATRRVIDRADNQGFATVGLGFASFAE